MAVYTYRIIDDLYASIRRTGDKIMSEMNVKLTADEFITTFVRADHVDALKKTEEIVGHVGDQSVTSKFKTSDDHTIHLYIKFAGSRPPIILPGYVTDGPNTDAPEPVMRRISAYVDERVRLGRLFGGAIDTLRYLNDTCGNSAAMAVMFPALPALFRNAGEYQNDPKSAHFGRGERLHNAKSFGALPKLPTEVKLQMMECSSAVQNVLMLEEAPVAQEKYVKGEATIRGAGMIDSYKDFIYEALGQVKDASFV